MAVIRAFALALLAALLPGAAVAEKPERIVSMNLCADQLVMLLADRTRIASVSYLAADSRASTLAREAEGLHLNHGLAEEILPLDPDLVIAGAFTTRPTVFLLRKLGYRVIDLPVEDDLDDIRANMRRVAEAVGEPARGKAMVAAFDARLTAAVRENAGPGPRVALYWANGFTSGAGTLADAIVTAAGLRNLAAELGVSGTGQLPLETLMAAEPDALVMGRARDGAALANETFRHPALGRRFTAHPKLRIADKHWICGTPSVASAIERLSAFRSEIERGDTAGH